MTTIVAIHGFAGGPSSFDRIRRPLEDRASFRTFELAGHGGSPRSAISLEDESSRVARLVAGTPGPVVLLGYSLGGRVALGALGHCELGAAVIVSAHPGLHDEGDRALRRRDDALLAESLRNEGPDAFFDAWEAQPLFVSQRELPAPVLAARTALRRSHEPRALADALARFSLGAMACHHDAIAAAAFPIRFVAGARDAKFAALAATCASLAKDGRVDIVDGVGHDVVLEAPDRVVAILTSVLGELG